MQYYFLVCVTPRNPSASPSVDTALILILLKNIIQQQYHFLVTQNTTANPSVDAILVLVLLTKDSIQEQYYFLVNFPTASTQSGSAHKQAIATTNLLSCKLPNR